MGLSSADQHSLRLVIQHNWVGAGKERRSRYRLVIYGNCQAHRDFDSLEDLIGLLRAAEIVVNVTAISSPDPQASSILLSQSVQADAWQISALGIDLD